MKLLNLLLLLSAFMLFMSCDLEHDEKPQSLDFVTIPSPAKYSKSFYCVPGSDHLFILADSVYISNDDAQTWKTVKLPSHAEFDTISNPVLPKYRNIFFTDSLTGYLCTNPARVLKTSDGGKSWHDQILPPVRELKSIFFTDSLHGFVVGDWETILATVDGGKNWTLQHQTQEDYGRFTYKHIFFSDKKHGLINGYQGTGTLHMWLTEDGGQTWIPYHHDWQEAQAFINQFAVYNDSTYYFSSDWEPVPCNTLFRSTDYGVTWQRVGGTFLNSTLSIAVYQNKYICVVGSAIFAISKDGTNWQQYDFTNIALENICINSRGYCFATGNYYNSVIYRSTKPINEMLK